MELFDQKLFFCLFFFTLSFRNRKNDSKEECVCVRACTLVNTDTWVGRGVFSTWSRRVSELMKMFLVSICLRTVDAIGNF